MIGTKLANRYELVRELGRGGMGVVYLAHDPLIDRHVAVKLVPAMHLSPSIEDRFLREARIVGRMDHPGIVVIYDIGEHEGSYFFVMPYVEGTNLRHALDSRSLKQSDAVEIGIQIAEALDYSHARGIVHRDIKPENVMITRGESGDLRVRITDFGVALVFSEQRITQTGGIVGTTHYLSPEQATQDEVDGRSDIYSLGTLLYESLANEIPFSGKMPSILYRIAFDPPTPLRLKRPDLGDALDAIVMQCLEKDPANRPARARDVADALARCREALREGGQADAPLATPNAAPRKRRSTPVFVGRKRELETLLQRYESALMGECQLVVVGGEAGIGKSRLLEEFERSIRVRGSRVLHGHFVGRDQALPYQGFCDAIQEYFGARAAPGATPAAEDDSPAVDFTDLASELAALFPTLAGLSGFRTSSTGTPRQRATSEMPARADDRTYIFELLAQTFLRITKDRPLVLLLENLHAAGVAIDAFQYVVRRLGPTPTLVVATFRSTEVDRHHPLLRMFNDFFSDGRFAQVLLEPLAPDESRAYIESLAGGAELGRPTAQRLYEATEGNPYFTRELVRSLLDSGELAEDDSRCLALSGDAEFSAGTLPATIQQAVELRIGRLSEDLRSILSTASVLNKTFEFRDLEFLARDAVDLEEQVDRLVAAGFLEEPREMRGDSLSFSSGAVRDVLYGELPRRKKRSLHRRYALHLEERFAGRLERAYPQLLHHFAHGDVAEKVLHYGILQGRAALEAFSAEEAMRAARTVLRHLDDDDGPSPVEGEARSLLAEAHQLAGNLDAAFLERERAVTAFERAGRTERAVAEMAAAAQTAWDGRKVEKAVQWTRRGIFAARAAGATESLAELLGLAATVANLRGEYAKAQSYLHEAEALRPERTRVEEELPTGGRITVAIATSVTASEPATVKLAEEEEILANVFETLVVTDGRGALSPGLCERWELREDGAAFSFVLRPEAHFQDGSPLRAADVAASIERSLRHAKEAVPAAFAAIRGALAFAEGAVERVEGIAIVSEREIVLRLVEPLTIYPALLTDVGTAIACERPAGGVVGTGPFSIAQFEPNRVVLERNENYWRGARPYLDSVEFRVAGSAAEIALGLRVGTFDLVRDLAPQDLDEILHDRRLRAGLVEATKKNVYFALFNLAGPLARHAPIRRALSGFVQLHDLVPRTLGRFAQPAGGIIPPDVLGHDPTRRREILTREQALDLLATLDAGRPLRLTAAVHPILRDRYASLTSALFAAWAEIGVEVEVVTDDMAAFLDRQHNPEGIDVTIGRWIADYGDPDNFTYGLFHSSAGYLREVYSSPKFDALVEQARGESRPAAREKLYRAVEALLVDGDVVLPLFHDVDYRIGGAKVRGLALGSSPPYVNYAGLAKADEPSPQPARAGGGTVRVPVPVEVPTLDPTRVFLVMQAEIVPLVFETLMREEAGARVVPWLASEVRAEPGGRSFFFRLRDGVRFHDGRRLTARDVRYTFERLLKSPDSETRWLFAPIRGAKPLLAGEAGELDGIQIHSATTFTIELDEPVSFFPAMLAYPTTAIVPEGGTTFEATWRDGCVGTGPFRVTRFKPGSKLKLEANPFYWRPGLPKCDAITFTFGVRPDEILAGFRAGRFSLAWALLPSDVTALRHEGEFASRYRESPLLSTYYVAFNTHKGPLADEQLRQKIRHSIDVPSLVARTVGRLALPAHGLIPPGLLGHEQGSWPALAYQTSPVAGVELSCLLNSAYEDQYAAVATAFLDALRAEGFRVHVVDTKSEYFSNQAEALATADIVLTRWIADYPDSDTFACSLLHSERGVVGRLCGTPEIDGLIERGRTESDPDVRHEIYREVEETIARRSLLLPLFHEQFTCFARPEIEDFEINYFSPFVAYEKLWVRER